MRVRMVRAESLRAWVGTIFEVTRHQLFVFLYDLVNQARCAAAIEAKSLSPLSWPSSSTTS